ncbi:alpha/beta hydrolase [Citromicrobium bathyomarinum]|uniref:alpha/beta fold hydrolase n=1 Tax=Citromicrobium bathyomarinum TaxID=72174 RepID=UPI00315B200E
MKWVLRILLVVVALLVVAFLIFRTPDSDPAEMRAKYGGEPSQFVAIGDGVTVHLRDEGPKEAPAIILLHGSNADLHTWQPWVDILKARYRVIRFDQIGHGLTGADPVGDYSQTNFVADIDEVADALGLESFVLGGNSMGGGNAVAYALAHPERLDGLVLVDAGGVPPLGESEEGDDDGGNIGFTIARTPVLNQLMKHITPRSMVEQSLRQSVSNQAIVTPQAVDRYWELLRYPGNRDATIARFAGERSSFEADDVAQIDVPALVIWGEDDALIPVEAGLWYDTQLPDSRLVVYSGIGHLPHEEVADRSGAYLLQWLDEQDFAPAANGPA